MTNAPVAPSFSHARSLQIEWGHCDPAGIVFNNAGKLAVEATETRVWTARDPDDGQHIGVQPIPDEIARRFRG